VPSAAIVVAGEALIEASAVAAGEDASTDAEGEVDGVVDVVVELWLREMTMIARSAIPAITVTITREEEPVELVELFAAGVLTGTLFAIGVLEIVATLFSTGGIIMRCGVRVAAFFVAFLATFLTTRLAGAFLATFLTTRLAGAFLATFLTTRLATAFFAGAFLATFLTTRLATAFFAGAFLATFFALFFTATVELLGFDGW